MTARRAAAAFTALCALPARAHGVGERYDLAAPLAWFVVGAAATVLLTFVAAIIAVRRARPQASPDASIALPAALRAGGHALRAVALAALQLVIAAGRWGNPHPARNIAPTLVWIVGWVGFSLCAALVVTPSPAIVPWTTVDRLARRDRAVRAWPERWGSRPAVALFLLFAWLEVVDPLASRPSHMAWLLLAWTAVNLGGMRRYGRDAWQRHADPLTIYFATLGRFAPLESAGARVIVRPWARALATRPPAAPAAFVVAMLATVLFDGLLGTQFWRGIDTAFARLAPGALERNQAILGSAGLLATFALFLLAYRGAAALAAALAGGHDAARVAQLFAPTLVPIAVAYLVAHNLAYFLVQGQGIVPLLSDPFGWGWNLFGTAGFTPEAGLVNARFSWYAALVAIVAGHVISVWLAHRVALEAWPDARRATRASLPLTVLMIGYTAMSLAIVAGPLTRYRTPDPSYSMAPGPLAEAFRNGDRFPQSGLLRLAQYADVLHTRI
jgi:hypothetical protein